KASSGSTGASAEEPADTAVIPGAPRISAARFFVSPCRWRQNRPEHGGRRWRGKGGRDEHGGLGPRVGGSGRGHGRGVGGAGGLRFACRQPGSPGGAAVGGAVP